MRRQEFEGHPIWAEIAHCLTSVEKLQKITEADEGLALKRISFLLRHAASYRSLAPVSSALFNEYLISPALSSVAQIQSALEQRVTGGSRYRDHTDMALSVAETLLTEVALWPRPYADGAQAHQISTLYEDLLEAQAREIDSTRAAYRETRASFKRLVAELEDKKHEVQSSFEAFQARGLEVSRSVDNEKTRVDEIVQSGLVSVNELQAQNSEAFEEWKSDTQVRLDTHLEQQHQDLQNTLARAAESLEKLKNDEKEFANLSAAAGGAKLAHQFENEAKSSHKLGLSLYGIGFLVLAAAAAPLVLWLTHPPAVAPEAVWQHFFIRVSLGIIGASAATVLIRLGSRFVSGATASKRMALELQTFGPFLANVKDKESVDGARLELVDRAFGKSYVSAQAESKDDAVPVSAFAHILDLVKAIK